MSSVETVEKIAQILDALSNGRALNGRPRAGCGVGHLSFAGALYVDCQSCHRQGNLANPAFDRLVCERNQSKPNDQLSQLY